MKREREGTETGKVQGKRTNFGLRRKKMLISHAQTFKLSTLQRSRILLKDFFIQPMSWFYQIINAFTNICNIRKWLWLQPQSIVLLLIEQENIPFLVIWKPDLHELWCITRLCWWSVWFRFLVCLLHIKLSCEHKTIQECNLGLMTDRTVWVQAQMGAIGLSDLQRSVKAVFNMRQNGALFARCNKGSHMSWQVQVCSHTCASL
jgi:hypothetical protein